MYGFEFDTQNQMYKAKIANKMKRASFLLEFQKSQRGKFVGMLLPPDILPAEVKSHLSSATLIRTKTMLSETFLKVKQDAYLKPEISTQHI